MAVKNNIKILFEIKGSVLYKFTGNDMNALISDWNALEQIRMETPAVLVQETAFVPVRYFCEGLGMTVDWNGAEGAVELSWDEGNGGQTNNDRAFYPDFKRLSSEGYFSHGITPRMETVSVEADLNADVMIVASEGKELPQKCIVKKDREEIQAFLRSYRWRDAHIPCCWSGEAPDYTVNFLYEDQLKEKILYRDDWKGIPYNLEMADALRAVIREFKNQTVFSYRYFITVPISVDYEALKEAMQENGFFLFSHKSEAEMPKYPYFYLEYQDNEKNYPNIDWMDFMDEYSLGEFEPDDIFIPIVEELKRDGIYESNDKVNFSRSGSQGLFVRRTRIYLKNPIEPETVKRYQEQWDVEIEYHVPQSYTVTLVADQIIPEKEIEALQEKYDIVFQKTVS